jgi:autotransporter-associated beta strand protein
MLKKIKKNAVIINAVFLLLAKSTAYAGSFVSPNDLVILQTNGDGGSGGESVTVLDLNVTGATSASAPSLSLNNSINFPTSSMTYNGSAVGLVVPDTGDHPGQITLSQDGHSLETATYLAPVGYVQYYGYATAPQSVTPSYAPRVATVIDTSGGVTAAATLAGANDYSAIDMRQVTSLNGQQFWLSGNGPKSQGVGDYGGLRYAVAGSTTSTSLNIEPVTDIRTTTIYQGQLYGDSGSNNSPPGEHTLSQLGTGLTTTSAPSWNPLPATGGGFGNGTIFGNQSPTFVTLNNGASVLYESDSTDSDIEKWIYLSGTWNYEGAVAAGGSKLTENLVARLNSDGSVSFFFDNNNATYTAGEVYGYTDTGGAGEMTLAGLTPILDSNGNHIYSPGTPIYSGQNTGTNSNPQVQKFWGLSFAPSSSKAVENQIWGNLDGVTGAAGGSWATAGNWSAGEIPNYSGSTATFGPGLTSNSAGGVITLDGPQTVGHIVFNDSAASYNLTAGSGGTLTIDNTAQYASGVPSIFNSNGSQTIGVPISLVAGVTIADHYNSSMVISSVISGNGGLQVYGPGALTFSGKSTYSGATVVHSGAVLVTASGQLPTTTDLTVGDTTDIAAIGTTAQLTYNASTGSFIRPIALNSLNLHSNGTVSLVVPNTTASRSVLVVGGLTFDGTTSAWAGQLDLNSNDMIVQGGSLKNITNQTAQGYNAGRWNGSGGIVSSAASADLTHLTALGVIQNNQSGTALYTAAKKFDTVTPNTSDILVKFTYYGDADLNGVVDGTDYSRIDAAYLADRTNLTAATGWFNGDFNYDGVIDGSDYTLMDNAYNTQRGSLADTIADPQAQTTAQIATLQATVIPLAIASPAASSAASPVPEPAAFTLCGVAVASLLSRRRRAQPQM